MKISFKVRTLNFFRNFFRIQLIESFLASQTQGKPPHHLVCKLVPNPYQYSSDTIRFLKRNGIVMKVDISDYIGHYLFFGFRDQSLEKLFSLCLENFTILDIGTNIGWTVLNLASIAKSGEVLGFEPDPYNFNKCSQNISLNNSQRICVFPVGLGNKNESVTMEIRTPSNRGGNRIAPKESSATCMVEIVRLDDFSPAQKLDRIDLVKIDVEGYELNVLRGAEYLLKKHKPILFIELDDNNLKDQGDSASALINFLYEMGYQQIENAENMDEITPSTDFRNCHIDIIVK
jgi:FkbM family methyltransferase